MIASPNRSVACFNLSADSILLLESGPQNGFCFKPFSSLVEFITFTETARHPFGAVLFECEKYTGQGIDFKKQLESAGYGHLPFCVLATAVDSTTARTLFAANINEVFTKPFSAQQIIRKLDFVISNRQNNEPKTEPLAYKMPLNKRIFDIVFASLVLLFISPVLALVALLIRLESKGPVFYYSLRVGTGYKIFKFYKFRSMSVDADKKLSQLKHLNQYSEGKTVTTAKVKQLCDACALNKAECKAALYADNEMWCEKLYKEHMQNSGGQTFLKIKDDPRITRVGKFIRNTSIDELPQLWNVIKGDMSLVGNRPLPLYEAEKLTTDKYALRFMAPAGITGLWQVSKRGSGKMSEEERISLDNDYAKSYGLLFDIKLLLRTIPALLQKENV